MKPALVFVYNANSGFFNTLADIAHKLFSPRTYACQLCALTHTPFGMRHEWKTFLAGLDRPLEFLHSNELESRHALRDMRDMPLPAILERDGDTLKTLLDARAINACRDLASLQALILDRLSARDTQGPERHA